MKTFTYVIKDEIGLHARPAGMLAKEAKKYESHLVIKANDKEADLSRLMAVMGLGVKQNDEVTITAEGSDEDAAIKELETFFKENV